MNKNWTAYRGIEADYGVAPDTFLAGELRNSGEYKTKKGREGGGEGCHYQKT